MRLFPALFQIKLVFNKNLRIFCAFQNNKREAASKRSFGAYKSTENKKTPHKQPDTRLRIVEAAMHRFYAVLFLFRMIIAAWLLLRSRLWIITAFNNRGLLSSPSDEKRSHRI